MNAHTAFASSFTPALTTTTNSFISPVTIRAPKSLIAAPRMILRTKEKQTVVQSPYRTLEANRAAKLNSAYSGPQGFTPYAEKVNGRLAQLGFVIGLLTEIITGKGIDQQILIMFSPLTHVAAVLAGIAQ